MFFLENGNVRFLGIEAKRARAHTRSELIPLIVVAVVGWIIVYRILNMATMTGE